MTEKLRHEVLTALIEQEKFLPFLNSGGTTEKMMNEFKDYKGLGWYAEHGTILKNPDRDDLQSLSSSPQEWKKPVIEVIEGKVLDSDDLLMNC